MEGYTAEIIGSALFIALSFSFMYIIHRRDKKKRGRNREKS